MYKKRPCFTGWSGIPATLPRKSSAAERGISSRTAQRNPALSQVWLHARDIGRSEFSEFGHATPGAAVNKEKDPGGRNAYQEGLDHV